MSLMTVIDSGRALDPSQPSENQPQGFCEFCQGGKTIYLLGLLWMESVEVFLLPPGCSLPKIETITGEPQSLELIPVTL